MNFLMSSTCSIERASHYVAVRCSETSALRDSISSFNAIITGAIRPNLEGSIETILSAAKVGSTEGLSSFLEKEVNPAEFVKIIPFSFLYRISHQVWGYFVKKIMKPTQLDNPKKRWKEGRLEIKNVDFFFSC